jgi:hypothetical protein
MRLRWAEQVALVAKGRDKQEIFVGTTARKKEEDSINKKFWEEPIAYFPSIRHGENEKIRGTHSKVIS